MKKAPNNLVPCTVVCFLLLLVCTLCFQFAVLNCVPSGAVLTANRLEDIAVSQGYLRSIARTEDKLLERIEEMSAEMKNMKLRHSNQQQLSADNGTYNDASFPLDVTWTPAKKLIDRTAVHDSICDQLRRSTSSMTLFVPYGAECKKRPLNEFEQPPTPLSIATIIPGLARDEDILGFFPKVLKSLEEQTVPSDEVVIALSGVFERVSVQFKARLPSDFNKFDTSKVSTFCRNSLQEFSKYLTRSPIKLVCIGERLSAGLARNAAVSAASSEILAFIDSDDTAYPIRNEVIRNLFDDSMPCRKQDGKPPLQLLIHSSRESEIKAHQYEKGRGYKFPNSNKVLPGNAWTGEQCLEQEDGLEVRNGRQLLNWMINLPASWRIAQEYHNVAYGHPVIRRSAFDKLQFSSMFKGEDALFLRDLLRTFSPQEAEHAAVLVVRPLTTYYASGKANSDVMKFSKQ